MLLTFYPVFLVKGRQHQDMEAWLRSIRESGHQISCEIFTADPSLQSSAVKDPQ